MDSYLKKMSFCVKEPLLNPSLLPYDPGDDSIFTYICSLSRPNRPCKKKTFERLIFPTKYVIPKSLRRLAIGQVSLVDFYGYPCLVNISSMDPISYTPVI